MKNDEVRTVVRDVYGGIAKAGSTCCASGCGCGPKATAGQVSSGLGYSGDELAAAPDGANLGLGCGNPQAIAGLNEGETVVDLGSGGGFDCFLAAKQVGEKGRVIGVDMTPEMVTRARENARKGGFSNVEFRIGEIEHLPVADDSVDVIISNCVINLSPEKPEVFGDAFRVLVPGGRLAVSDIVALAPLPEEIKSDLQMIAGCVAGAAPIEDIEAMLKRAGFVDIKVTPLETSSEIISDFAPGRGIENYVASANIEARKPE